MDLLRQYQGIEKQPCKEQECGAQQEQARRAAFTAPGLIGAAPGVQAGARGAEVAAVQPTVTGARTAGQTFGSQLETFGDILSQSRLIQQGMEAAANQARDDARDIVKDALASFGSSAFGIVDPKELAGLEKLAGYPKGFLLQMSKTLKERELELKEQEPKIGGNVDIYARDVLTGKITLSSVPDKIQTQVSMRVSEFKKTERTLSDEEIRAFVRQKQTTKDGLPRSKGELRDLIIRDKTLTEPDRQKFYMILDEMMPDVQPEENRGFFSRLFGR
jgi:hypothetical protein